jgi:hypothetical protein
VRLGKSEREKVTEEEELRRIESQRIKEQKRKIKEKEG